MDEQRHKLIVHLKQIVDHELYPEMMMLIKAELMTAIVSTDLSEKEKREDLYNEYRAVSRVEGKLGAYLGELAILEHRKEADSGKIYDPMVIEKEKELTNE